MCSFLFFFFKQKTAYEMLRSLVGSEMCIRDRNNVISIPQRRSQALQTLVSASGSSATAASSGAEEEERLKQLLRDGGAQKENILLEPRSLLILTGEARYPVSYTHLTLPTKRIVEISVVAVSLKKKK
eukprot:TRINITY_DN65285_c0_g1_i1.p1 TRINITY_DN65285_c0_g1~~TRINITY_DN65285_c0_g1_i1.p1  ORF type:complete len:128 (-),score=43.85 TRINITY_DN65285_c0_g1_i1:32-415(-)